VSDLAILLAVDHGELAFEFASDASKQLITLSTGILALSVTFIKDIVKAPTKAVWTLKAAWVTYICSIAFGAWTSFALTGTLAAESFRPSNIYDFNIRVPAALQVVTFLVATIFIVVYGARELTALKRKG